MRRFSRSGEAGGLVVLMRGSRRTGSCGLRVVVEFAGGAVAGGERERECECVFVCVCGGSVKAEFEVREG